jgi:hypothetical protein
VTTWEVIKVGVKHAGPCVVCGCQTGAADHEKDKDTLLVKRVGAWEKLGVAHPLCAGGKIDWQGGVTVKWVGPKRFTTPC